MKGCKALDGDLRRVVVVVQRKYDVEWCYECYSWAV